MATLLFVKIFNPIVTEAIPGCKQACQVFRRAHRLTSQSCSFIRFSTGSPLYAAVKER
ncbi:hypothetical protein AB434_1526 [Heyndrickxia coagulans]|uniref:Uncharacterized protein n=1 Tax=Heyndrickxia coagulans TaxID=1398 RepID=A0AAN0T857_HEYCO|nr:hypothetical protein SB48_HM08orf06078 [Heyndrickxia coagulans]AKN53931.1 hypothetical protein AB434_1526 [Heyndrickxia coagulans]KYC66321.1 hypothetical protein B4100_1047 [Heyndrickxia coagulans]